MILRRFITGNGIFAFLDLPRFPLYLLVIALFNPWLGLFACGGAVVLIVLALLNERLSGPPLTAANRSSAAAQGMQGSHFAHTEPAEAMGMQQYLRQRWLNRHCDSLKEQTQASDYSAKIMTITKTVRLILQSLMLGLGGWLALDNTISPGMMIAGRFCWDARCRRLSRSPVCGKALKRADWRISGLLRCWRLTRNHRRNWHCRFRRESVGFSYAGGLSRL